LANVIFSRIAVKNLTCLHRFTPLTFSVKSLMFTLFAYLFIYLLTYLFMLLSIADMTAVHVSNVYGHSPPVAKDAGAVAKDHVIPGNNACLSSKTTTTAAVEPVPVPRYNELANQRSLSDKLDLSVASAGISLHQLHVFLLPPARLVMPLSAYSGNDNTRGFPKYSDISRHSKSS